MSNLGSTKIFVDKAQWNNRTSRQKGRSSEALAVNANLDAISSSLHSLYHKSIIYQSRHKLIIGGMMLGVYLSFSSLRSLIAASSLISAS